MANAINLFDLITPTPFVAPTPAEQVTVNAPDADWNAYRILVNGSLLTVVPADMPEMVAGVVAAAVASIAAA